jgi:hypothetical protein
MHLLISIFLVAAITGSDTGNLNWDTASVEAKVKEIFTYARNKDVCSLEKLREDIIASSNKTLKNIYPLALYIAQPDTYRKEFVESFPTDSEGLMSDLYQSVEVEDLTPTFMFSFESLGAIAAGGDEKAIQKLFEGVVHSDGAVTSIFCEQILAVLKRQSRKSIKALSALPIEQRKNIYWICLVGEDKDTLREIIQRMQAERGQASQKERAVITEIGELLLKNDQGSEPTH